jgi:hypothetical protein
MRLSTVRVRAFNPQRGDFPHIRPVRRGARPAYDRAVQLRRGLIAFALVLAAVTAAAALSSTGGGDSGGAGPAAAARPAGPPPVVVDFRHPAAKQVPERPVRLGSHVILHVSAAVTGTAEVDGLGLVQPVEPATPAAFDLLATRPGRFDVTVVPAGGERTRVGTLVVGGGP